MRPFCLLPALCLLAAPAWAQFSGGRPAHDLFLAGAGYYARVTPDGKTAQTWRGGNNNDGWLLPNGHILAADGSAWEADASGRRVWQYVSEDKTGGGVYSCQRLPNGNTLIGENSTGRVFELTPKGERLNVIQVPLNKANRHQTLRMVRRLSNGDTLVCRSGAGIVELYGPDLAKKWSQKVPGLAFAAVPDPAGNLYVASLDRIQLWSPDHRLLWEFVGARSGLPIRNMTGLHLLPNGNLVVGCYAYGKGDVGAFEIAPNKTILWRYAAPNRGRDSHMAVQLLDPAIASPNR